MAKIAYFDTETTGIDPKKDRICSLAIILMEDGVPVFAKEYFFNPERPVPPEATAVHGLTDEFLATQPKFAELIPQIREDWTQACEHVAHNAEFDVKMIKAELARAKADPFSYVTVTDTLAIARELYPSAKVTLDRLCDIMSVDRSGRTFHGALLDCELLAQVHVRLVEQQAMRRSILADLLQVTDLNSITGMDLAKRAEFYSKLKAWGGMLETLQEAIRDSVLAEVPASTEGDGYAVEYRDSTRTKWEQAAKDLIPDFDQADLTSYQSKSRSLYLTWK